MYDKSALSKTKAGTLGQGTPVNNTMMASGVSGNNGNDTAETASETPLNISLFPTEDRMAITLTCDAPPARLDELLCQIESILMGLGIREEEKLDQAKQRTLKAISSDTHLIGLVLLEGRTPVPPMDGNIEWADDFFREGFVVDENNRIDYRRLASDRSVSPGQLLAWLTPPKEGEDGQDVFGKVLRVRTARPARLQPGKNVEFREEEARYYATSAGRIRCTGKAVHVDDVYTINGNVGLKTGNIKHAGALVVMQDIESDARVEAEGDIEVHGNIEDAEVRTNGKLIVHGGICGRERCIIRAGDSVTARFIQNADIEAGGNIVAEREIDKSDAKARGIVLAGSRIVGGVVMALGGIESDQIGSEGCVRTTLIAGEDFQLNRQVAAMEAELAGLSVTLEKISTKISPFKHQIRSLSPKVQHAVATLIKESQRIKAAMDEINEKMTEAKAESKERRKNKIVAKRIIYPETAYQIMSLTLMVREQVFGPVQVVIHEGDIHVKEVRGGRPGK